MRSVVKTETARTERRREVKRINVVKIRKKERGLVSSELSESAARVTW